MCLNGKKDIHNENQYIYENMKNVIDMESLKMEKGRWFVISDISYP